MKLGGFGLMEHYTSMHAAGYDYAELDMPELEALGEEDFARFQDVVAATGLPVRTGARILPIVAHGRCKRRRTLKRKRFFWISCACWPRSRENTGRS